MTKASVNLYTMAAKAPHKRRVVLWLSVEDYEYFHNVVKNDRTSKSKSAHRLLSMLREADITSFQRSLLIERPSPLPNVQRFRRIA